MMMADHDSMDVSPTHKSVRRVSNSPTRHGPRKDADSVSPRRALAKLQVNWGDEKAPPPPPSVVSPPTAAPAQLTALASLQAEEKDAIIVYLLQKVKDQKAMQEAAIKFGEEIAAQLVLEQHERNAAYEDQIQELQTALHAATHAHPEVDRLSAVVLDLKLQLEKERLNVQSAIKKCRRSREREKQLKMAIDPLWE
ncbi:Aste57867_21829 [Aphanomyces stellatus]|uniref:Aste57867_21829 protein n=1 Tax=Aphanomyces stellatus TaxID=120398 RepID=A0A485LJ89_9STRA|nr:hypothetical protein As57867_021760 [Aphanomyces stellatus]VFT98498.1 Aste57867_21829 [Aphanomyces stellatus]